MNIRALLAVLVLPELFGMSVVCAAEQPLFDGRSLAGWEGNTNNWRVEGDEIVARTLARKASSAYCRAACSGVRRVAKALALSALTGSLLNFWPGASSISTAISRAPILTITLCP